MYKMGAAGFETEGVSPMKTLGIGNAVDEGAVKSAVTGVLPADLAVVVEAWHSLADDVRERIVSLVDAASVGAGE